MDAFWWYHHISWTKKHGCRHQTCASSCNRKEVMTKNLKFKISLAAILENVKKKNPTISQWLILVDFLWDVLRVIQTKCNQNLVVMENEIHVIFYWPHTLQTHLIEFCILISFAYIYICNCFPLYKYYCEQYVYITSNNRGHGYFYVIAS
jgi:hypothetical protein